MSAFMSGGIGMCGYCGTDTEHAIGRVELNDELVLQDETDTRLALDLERAELEGLGAGRTSAQLWLLRGENGR